MTSPRHALEITGAGLTLAGSGAVVVAEPAWATFEHEPVVVGHSAAAYARVAPLFSSSRHLEEPTTAPLPRQKPTARCSADLVYAQLLTLAGEHGLAAQPLLLAVSSAYSLEQLRLLVGVVRAAGCEPAGVVDAAVAAAADLPSSGRALHLDLEMHRAVLTELVRGEDLRRGRVDLSRTVGLRPVEDALAQLIARTFVRATRFDPLHQALTEQALYDRLPEWLVAAGGGEATLVMEHGGLRHEARLAEPQLRAALAPLTAELARLVHAARRAGEAVTLYLSGRAMAVPGLAAELGALRDLVVVPLARGAAAAGALAHGAEIAGGELALVNRLSAAPPVAAPLAAAGAAVAAPTHVVYQGRAHALGPQPLLVGRAPAGPRTLLLSGDLAGVSRSHCALVSRDGDAVLEDLSTYGTFVNGERVARRARLMAGDRIRIGTPGVALELVRLDG